MRKLWNKLGWRDVFFLAIIAKLVDSLYKCRKQPTGTKDRTGARYIRNQLIIMKKDDVSEDEFEKWKFSKLRKLSIKLSSVCTYCDNTLELWEGNNVQTFIAGNPKTASGGNSSGDDPLIEGGGEDPVAYFSYNIEIDFPENLIDECEIQKYRDGKETVDVPDTIPGKPVIVAVFDTGLRDSMKNIYTKGIQKSCKPGGETGWNFVNDTPDTNDDNIIEHGSVVTRFIMDQVRKYKKQPINILPVKIHNQDGVSTLFSVLCGFAYAANCGARIINASFGFYGRLKSDAPALLTAFVQKHLEANNILLVAAAGNANAQEDSEFLANSTNNARDLEEHPFYPACLAKECKNVLTVTTISARDEKATVSPDQNFSNNIVELGVNCDEVNRYGHFTFSHPLNTTTMIYGSSYATPIVTGIIAQHYDEIMDFMPGGIIDKKLVIKKLADLSKVVKDDRLEPFVKKGHYCEK